MTRSLSYRRSIDLLMRVLIYLGSGLALLPLALVLLYVLINGFPALSSLSFITQPEHPTGIPGGGVANALLGTITMVGLASLLAVPVGVIVGSQLAALGRGGIIDLIRLCNDALVATPSIAFGLFIYALLVAPTHTFSGIAGAVALALLMLAPIVRTTETAVAQVEGELRQAGLALGLAGWQVSLRLILPAALPGVLTGVILATARAAGESAPLLFTSLGNRLLSFDPSQPMTALPLVIYHDALTPYSDLQQTAWGAALVLILLVLGVNLLMRLLTQRSRIWR